MADFDFDPERALGGVRRLLADAPAQLAGGIGRLVRDAPPERLERFMRSPARRAVLEAIFRQMPRQLDSERAGGVTMHVRWQITGGPEDSTDVYDLHVERGRARTSRGEAAGGPPRLTVTMNGAELLRLVSGNSDPMAAYFKGRIVLTGDITAAAQLATIFRMPGAAPTRNRPTAADDLDDEPSA